MFFYDEYVTLPVSLNSFAGGSVLEKNQTGEGHRPHLPKKPVFLKIGVIQTFDAAIQCQTVGAVVMPELQSGGIG